MRLLQIEIERAIDFIWAKATGAPALYRSQVTKHLFVGGQYSRRGIRRLKKWGVTGIISMRQSVPKIYKESGDFSVLHLPTPDRHAPKLKDLFRGVQFIEKQIKKGGKVYVHCFWGEGRGPSMAIAYLISTGLSPEQAEAEVKKVRTFIRPTKVQRLKLSKLASFFDNK